MCARRLFAAFAVVLLLHGASSSTIFAENGEVIEEIGRERAETDDEIAIEVDEIALVELELKGRTITGRLISETEDVVKVKVLGAGEIGYSRKLINNLKRRTVPRDVYYEMVGDYYANRTWDFKNDLEDFIQARKSYARALLYAKGKDRKDELRDKYENIREEREEWQRENVKQEELRRAEKEAETAQIERELTRKKLENLESMRGYRQRIMQLEDTVIQLSREVQYLRSVILGLEDELSDLESSYYRFGRGYYYSSPYPRFHYRYDRDRDRRDDSGSRRNNSDDSSSESQQSPEEEQEEEKSPFGWQPKPW